MNKFFSVAAAVVIAAAGCVAVAHAENITGDVIINVPGTQAAPQGHEEHWDRHPEMKAAAEKLQHAKEDLEHAAHDYGGHRESAQKHIDAALDEIHQALEYSNHHDHWDHQ